MPFVIALLPQIVHYAALAAGFFIASRLRKPKDHERAELISRIVDAAVAEYLALRPGSAIWADAVRDITKFLITGGNGVTAPTRNAAVLRREIIRALESRGISAPNTAATLPSR